MAPGKKKTVKFSEDDLGNIANNKPAVYTIFNARGENIYTGSAKRGRLEERLKEHLRGGPDPVPGGTKVKIQQKQTIAEAEKSEAATIERVKPKHNRRGK